MLKLDVHFLPDQPGQINVYQRCASEFARRGIKLQFLPGASPSTDSNADGFIIQQHFASRELIALGRPILIEERSDSSMPLSRKYLGCAELIACSKISLVCKEWMNLPVKRPHAWILSKEVTWPNQRPLCENEVQKLKAGFHFGMYDRMLPWVHRASGAVNDKWHQRDIDVLFIGQTRYDYECLSAHRQHLCKILRNFGRHVVYCVPERALTAKEYFSVSHRAKIVISPWGYGELCYRDFETMLDKAILVKPSTTFLTTLDHALAAHLNYVPCSPDWSDLECIIDTILCRGDSEHLAMREQACGKILHWWDSRNIVDWWVQQFFGKFCV